MAREEQLSPYSFLLISSECNPTPFRIVGHLIVFTTALRKITL
jgi:hypothetical protein